MTSYLRRISPPMAVAILALVIALTSSATAALMITGKQVRDHSITGKDLKKNAVKSKTIKNKTIRGKDLRKNAVKSIHVKDSSLTSADLKSSSVMGEDLADGAISTRHLSSTVLQSLGGAAGFQVVTAQSTGGAPVVARTVTTTCPAGKVAISANAYTASPIDLLPPTQIERVDNRSFTAYDANEVNVLAAGPLTLQVTCVTG